MNYDKNPLRETQGKGDGARSCHNPKFRKNYDEINWGWGNKTTRKWVKDMAVKEPWIKITEKKKKK